MSGIFYNFILGQKKTTIIFARSPHTHKHTKPFPFENYTYRRSSYAATLYYSTRKKLNFLFLRKKTASCGLLAILLSYNILIGLVPSSYFATTGPKKNNKRPRETEEKKDMFFGSKKKAAEPAPASARATDSSYEEALTGWFLSLCGKDIQL